MTLGPLPDSTTSTGSPAYGEDLEEEKNSGASFGASVGCGVCEVSQGALQSNSGGDMGMRSRTPAQSIQQAQHVLIGLQIVPNPITEC